MSYNEKTLKAAAKILRNADRDSWWEFLGNVFVDPDTCAYCQLEKILDTLQVMGMHASALIDHLHPKNNDELPVS